MKMPDEEPTQPTEPSEPPPAPAEESPFSVPLMEEIEKGLNPLSKEERDGD